MLNLLLTVFVCVSAVKWHQLANYNFNQYQSEFNKVYSLTEINFRKNIFDLRLTEIIAHNKNPMYTWKKGVNHFTDRTTAELNFMLGSRPGHLKSDSNYKTKFYKLSSGIGVDWRSKNVITAVKNQGNCGSCWAFAAVETIESSYAILTGKLENLSEQQILDCTPNLNHCGGSGGCNGGTVELAYDQVTKMGGLSSEWTYPYTSFYGEPSNCNKTKSKPVVAVKSYDVLEQNKYQPFIDYVSSDGPVAVSVDASNWFMYESGVFNGCNQTVIDLNHAVQLVGFGTDLNLGDYWLVRNSWSTVWGENGYIRLYRSPEVTCGIDNSPADGSGCNGGPNSVVVCGTCGILYEGVYPHVTVI